jgi:phosphohistidine phosphatase
MLGKMLTLSLLRHAKSSWDDPSLEDFDRPLAKRGIEAAGRMGRHIQAHDLVPALVICSDALRARQTLELLLPHLAEKPPIVYDRGLYLASPRAMLERVRKLDAAKAGHAMLVGHDPGMHSLAVELAGSGEASQLRALARKFPTAALAVIAFSGRDWAKIAPAKGQLKLFVTPKMLA